ncbi:extracellular solute-binding protein [Paenibacillus sp. HJGM_3]|uniref:extracellular solute-binding protein n=1 Tax=Paenibacillus sp. HJGM_3 TaxID=3379816 RepID=UPI0038592534
MSEKPSRRSFRRRMEELVTRLREEILSGLRPNGAYLPSLNELTEQYQLSKNSVQKGLDQLVSESLIERVPSVGIRVIYREAEEPALLRFGYYPSMYREAELEQLLMDFHAQHPNIRVQTIPLIYQNYYETVKAYFSNDLLDVITINHHNFEQFRGRGQEPDIEFEQVVPSEETYPFLHRAFSIGSTLYVQPFIFSPVILCYNPEHFRESGIPQPDESWTWDKLIEYSESLKGRNNRYPFYFYPHSDHRWPIFLLQSGFKLERDPSGKARICGTPFLEGLQKSFELIQTQGIFPAFLAESDMDAEELFLQQNISIMMTTYFNLNRLKHEAIPYALAPLPRLHTSKTLLLITGLAVHKHSKQKEAARTLVQFLTSYQAQLHIRQTTVSIPAMRKAAEWKGEERINRPEAFDVYEKLVPTYAQLSELRLEHEDLSTIRNRLKLYWSGLEDLESTCKWLEDHL